MKTILLWSGFLIFFGIVLLVLTAWDRLINGEETWD